MHTILVDLRTQKELLHAFDQERHKSLFLESNPLERMEAVSATYPNIGRNMTGKMMGLGRGAGPLVK